MKKELQLNLKEISKIKVTNFKLIEEEEILTTYILFATAEYIDKYNCGFLPLQNNLSGVQNFITLCLNFLNDDNINYFYVINKILKGKEKENIFSNYYEEILEIYDNEIDAETWHLIFTKTLIKIKLFTNFKK